MNARGALLPRPGYQIPPSGTARAVQKYRSRRHLQRSSLVEALVGTERETVG